VGVVFLTFHPDAGDDDDDDDDQAVALTEA
jgi:hypothetical protein